MRGWAVSVSVVSAVVLLAALRARLASLRFSLLIYLADLRFGMVYLVVMRVYAQVSIVIVGY